MAATRKTPAPDDKTDLGGIPSTTDAGLSPSASGSSDMTADRPAGPGRPSARDEPEPARQHGETERAPRQRGARRSAQPAGSKAEDDDNPLESIGKAVSAPVRNAADEDAGEKPR
jgi:hypothetical protein